MKSTESTQKASHEKSITPATLEPGTDAYDIAAIAYFKAEARGFEPGHALDDWLEAEAEVSTRQ